MSKRFTISLPDDAYDLLLVDAERNCRTLSEEITYMIRTHKGNSAIPQFTTPINTHTTIT